VLNRELSASFQDYQKAAHFNRLFTSVNGSPVFVKDCVTSFPESNSIFTVFG
jgi:hypothetical protein